MVRVFSIFCRSGAGRGDVRAGGCGSRFWLKVEGARGFFPRRTEWGEQRGPGGSAGRDGGVVKLILSNPIGINNWLTFSLLIREELWLFLSFLSDRSASLPSDNCAVLQCKCCSRREYQAKTRNPQQLARTRLVNRASSSSTTTASSHPPIQPLPRALSDCTNLYSRKLFTTTHHHHHHCYYMYIQHGSRATVFQLLGVRARPTTAGDEKEPNRIASIREEQA